MGVSFIGLSVVAVVMKVQARKAAAWAGYAIAMAHTKF